MNTNPTHEEMLEIAEQRQSVQAAINSIGECSEVLKNLAKIDKEELLEQLRIKKKENFTLVSDACMKEYEKEYGKMSEDEYWVFMESTYFATGEGHTTCLMMTQANPYGDDFDFEGPNPYIPLTTKEYRAVREFHEEFGTWHLYGLRFHSREAFFTNYASMIPPIMQGLKDRKCFLTFKTKIHYNFS